MAIQLIINIEKEDPVSRLLHPVQYFAQLQVFYRRYKLSAKKKLEISQYFTSIILVC